MNSVSRSPCCQAYLFYSYLLPASILPQASFVHPLHVDPPRLVDEYRLAGLAGATLPVPSMTLLLCSSRHLSLPL